MKPIRSGFVALLMALVMALWCRRADAAQSIVNTRHNLSASGKFDVHATSEQEICIFCHTPHHAGTVVPLWNRNMPVNSYQPYSSPTMPIKPGAVQGTSKLCLSCHDGTVALGSVLSRQSPIGMAGGINSLQGRDSSFGRDLSDSHPISFAYTNELVQSVPNLASPGVLTGTPMRLDGNSQLQCRTCHDPHDNTNGSFLVMDNSSSQMCKTCHLQHQTDIPQHANCSDCHQQHHAPSKAELLRADTASDTCLLCHGGSSNAPSNTVAANSTLAGPTAIAGGRMTPMLAVRPTAQTAAIGVQTNGQNISTDLTKISRHDTHPSADGIKNDPRSVNCANCHEPHTMKSDRNRAPFLPGNFGKIAGVNAAGSPVPTAKYEYEVCFRCHGDRSAVRPTISRQIAQTNLRLAFSTSAISFHPVEAPGKGRDVPSLRTGHTAGSIIYCNDCHNSDTGKKAGSRGPAGVHGSNEKPLLVARYETRDGSSESASAYALCYRCHTRASILGNESFPAHKKHVVDLRTPCSVCHDAHGISSVQGSPQHNTHLINFDITVVRPDPVTKRLEYDAGGMRHGACYVTCHGTVHSGKRY